MQRDLVIMHAFEQMLTRLPPELGSLPFTEAEWLVMIWQMCPKIP
jgi:hypothetical protein